MGGYAFKDINVPRLPTEVYLECRSKVLEQLLRVFSHVSCPRKQPDKTDHGDLDIIVVLPPDNADLNLDVVSRALRSKHIRTSMKIKYFGVRLSYLHAGALEDEYVQIDIETCRNEKELKWIEWDQDFGDITKILGSVVKPFGLTINDEGLWLHIPEIEPYHEEESLVFLSSNPDAVMEFLGLDVNQHHQGFDNDHDVFTWISKCRLYDPVYIATRIPKWRTDKSDIKRRMERPMFKKFVDEWFDANLTIAKSSQGTQPTRSHVVTEAVNFFGCSDEYIRKMTGHYKLSRHKAMRQKIVDTLEQVEPTKSSRIKIMNGYQRWVSVKENGFPDVGNDNGRLVMLLEENHENGSTNSTGSSTTISARTSEQRATSDTSVSAVSSAPSFPSKLELWTALTLETFAIPYEPNESDVLGGERDKSMQWLHDCNLTEEQLSEWVERSWRYVLEREMAHSVARKAAELGKQREKSRLADEKKSAKGEPLVLHDKQEEGQQSMAGEIEKSEELVEQDQTAQKLLLRAEAIMG